MPLTIFDPERGDRVPIHVWARAALRESAAQLERIAADRPSFVRHRAKLGMKNRALRTPLPDGGGQRSRRTAVP
jgi:hypothetical protein